MRFKSLFLTVIATTVLLSHPLSGGAQSINTERVTLNLKDESLSSAIKKIEQQSVLRFFYRDADIVSINRLNLNAGTRTIEQTLNTLLQNTPLSFRQMDHNILPERKNPAAWYEIKGKIISSADRQPVANASVFLSKTSTGAKTANDGVFTLYNVKPGKYQLTVSIVGFETYMQTISVENNNITLPDIIVSPKVIALKEVTIKSVTAADREKYYEWFKDEFIGTSELAQDCKILNPEILDLDYDEATGTLTASAPDFLEIENDALGYKIRYKLAGFTLENKEKTLQKIHYEGYSLFEEMKGSASQQKRWQRRRQKVYEGSPMHFLRSALAGRMDQEGFWALRYMTYLNPARPGDSLIDAKIKLYTKLKSEGTDVRDSLSWWSKRKKLPKMRDTLLSDLLQKKDIIRPTDKAGLFALGLTNHAYSLYINYNKHHFISVTVDKKGVEHHDLNIHAFDNLSGPDNTENTLIRFNTPYAFFDSNGIIINSNDLSYSGVWGRERVAELLPIDYDPAQSASGSVENGFVNDVGPGGQLTALSAALLKLKTVSDSVSDLDASEKPYLQFDKSYYALGDTLWFKAYLLKSTSLAPSEKSGIMYIDLVNDSSKIVKRYSVPVQHGISWGNLFLDEKELAAGAYTLRAYTSWMRNFNNDYIFYKTFILTGAGETNWLIGKQVTNANGSSDANIKLLFSDIDGKPDTGKAMLLNVFGGGKHLYKQTLRADKNGLMDFNLKFPEKQSKLVITAENAEEKKKAVIPVTLSRPEDTDVQFLPEGGSLVASLPSYVGFKAIGTDGRGVDISGTISDSHGRQVAGFKSMHNGMGSFKLTPDEGEKYTAKVTLPGGTIKTCALPEVKVGGTILHVQNQFATDSLVVTLTASNDYASPRNNYFLIGKARGVVCYAAVVNFKEGNFIKKKIAKALFPAGIAHFTLMTAGRQPLNERLTYIEKDDLHIRLINAGSSFQPKDSVALKIKVTDGAGAPVTGNFSLAVTDDANVKIDSLNNFNISSYLLLTSDLKGCVEAPGYYLPAKNAETWQALDNLLLTQGWVGYDWQNVFNPPANTYKPEQDFKVKGNVVNVFNKPVKGTNVFLFSTKPSIIMDTLTNDSGKFVFDHFPRVDTPVFVLKAVNKNGKSFNVLIRTDEVQPAAVVTLPGPLTEPWYVNSDSTLLNYARSTSLQQQLAYYKTTGHLLKEVKITAKKIIKDSQNLNGSGNADVILDEKDLEAAGKKTWLQLLQENLPKFEDRFFSQGSGISAVRDWFLAQFVTEELPIIRNSSPPQEWYFVEGKPLVLIVDGMSADGMLEIGSFRDLKDYLSSNSAEDIKGFEVIHSTKYATAYFNRFQPYSPIPLVEKASTIPTPVLLGPSDFAFVEITTRSGHGPIMDNTPGMYLDKPLALSWPKKFYKPRYEPNDTTKHAPDFRSTIDWEPNVFTDEKGEATVSFFAANKPSTYTVSIEGTDMNGNVGHNTAKISIGALKPKVEGALKSRGK